MMDDKTRTELEAAAFRKLVQHLRERTDVQNLDLMNLAGFCRNCLSRWYREAAEERLLGLEVLEIVEEDVDGHVADGSPKHWHAFHILARKHQKESTPAQKQAAASHGHKH